MAVSGQITVATAGTAVQGPASPSGARFAIKAHPDNTDTVWVGESGGAVSRGKGYPLNPGEPIIRECGWLAGLWFDSDVNGGKFCWFLIE